MSDFPVLLSPPDLNPWRQGNTGVAGVTSIASSRPGPHVVLMALMHGNELAGAIVLDRLLRQNFQPIAGRLSFAFVNLQAFDRFDPAAPTRSRCVDEDLNRVWDPMVLAGGRRSCELDRAREIWGFLQDAEIVLDLHSMLWPSTPLLLSGENEQTLSLCRRIGRPGLIVADPGHARGKRQIDHPQFSAPDATRHAVLLEAGQHWQPATVDETEAFVMRALAVLGVASPTAPAAAPMPKPTAARVTHTITARGHHFRFARPFVGGEVIPRRDTLLACDGDAEIRTPYDDCMLVMPNPLPGAGHTAVRLAYVDRTETSFEGRL